MAKGARCAVIARMTPERWKRIEELYHEARARPPAERAAFLADACSDDEAMRRNVESLLADSESDDGFLEEPALATSAQKVTDFVLTTMSGASLGGYQLQALLGAGGMGEVYQAHDAKLGRDVAIKILPPAFTSNPDRLARFEREARMLASLNHPNICGIYGIEEADGIRFLILELVEGETLADTLADVSSPHRNGGGLPLDDVLAIARQIAEALEVAHDKGIMHRDLKPANIKITPDGVVKVLDFGLAKAVGGEGAIARPVERTAGTGGRREGAVIGTAAYMSPEQARGLPVDKRTDIWAFGCVFYEMLTGRVTFAGDTVSDSIAKILEREPDWSALPAATPAAGSAAPAPLSDEGSEAAPARHRRRPDRDRRDRRSAAGRDRAGAARSCEESHDMAAVGRVRSARRGHRRVGGQTPSDSGGEPARQRHVLARHELGGHGGARRNLARRQVRRVPRRQGWTARRLGESGGYRTVRQPHDRHPSDVDARKSPAKPWVFRATGRRSGSVAPAIPEEKKVLMPLTGGTPRPFLARGQSAPSWSPDDTRLAYIGSSEPGDPLSLADRTGADPRPIVVHDPGKEAFFRKGVHTHNPVWSPDGQWIYFVHGADPFGEMEVWRMRPSGELPEQLTHQNAPVNFLAPLDSRTLLYVARAEDWSGPWLWALDVESKGTRRVTVGLEQYTSVSASRNGRRVVATVANPTASLWRVPVLDRLVEERDAQPYSVQPNAPWRRGSVGGRCFIFALRPRDRRRALAGIRNGQAFEVRRGADGVLAEPPAASPDGSRVGVVVRQQGKRRIAVMSADGTNSRTLAPSIEVKGVAGQGMADWSPDGAWIVTGGNDGQGEGLFKIPVDGGPPERLVTGEARGPVWSPNGDLIVYATPFAGAGGRDALRGVTTGWHSG